MNKSALIIGRFQPIHLGHLSLIERYHKAGFFIKIGIGSAGASHEKHNPLSIVERRKLIEIAMKERRIKNYKIFNIPDIKNSNCYAKHVLRIVGEFDAVVTGNPAVLKVFLKQKHKSSWNIECFEESISRPGGNITSGIIRKNWRNKPSKKGLLDSTFKYLKKINFSHRLKSVNRVAVRGETATEPRGDFL
jgi:nicotinamide-nucleotide adenylyltransferase